MVFKVGLEEVLRKKFLIKINRILDGYLSQEGFHRNMIGLSAW